MVAKSANTNGKAKKVDGRSKTSAANGRKGGRPRVEIDEAVLFELAKIHCTLDEMGHILGCAASVLSTRFSNVIEDAKAQGRASLRRSMYLKAKDGNVQILIWLGKNVLGQADRQDVTSGGLPTIQVIGVNPDCL